MWQDSKGEVGSLEARFISVGLGLCQPGVSVVRRRSFSSVRSVNLRGQAGKRGGQHHPAPSLRAGQERQPHPTLEIPRLILWWGLGCERVETSTDGALVQPGSRGGHEVQGTSGTPKSLGTNQKCIESQYQKCSLQHCLYAHVTEDLSPAPH